MMYINIYIYNTNNKEYMYSKKTSHPVFSNVKDESTSTETLQSLLPRWDGRQTAQDFGHVVRFHQPN